ncbi:hypothetical protein RJ640_022285 [Escallonia rubra]|uniref:Homeobox domain-containing protein n=1 Tax=Escallonia rubra TaxID=112253 RepID=A0AA88R2V1_9ASTE|nr:hypothetical protein RJ640_022285 [Escallonia rubra]
MELGLSLGDSSKPFGFLSKAREITSTTTNGLQGFCMALGINSSTGARAQQKSRSHDEDDDDDDTSEEEEEEDEDDDETTNGRPSLDPPVQLDLLPLSPVLPDNASSEGGSPGTAARGFDVNRLPATAAAVGEEVTSSSFLMDFCMFRGGKKRDSEAAGNDAAEAERASSRASDEDENGLSRKKLRLSKEQSAYLEESFKEHTTLNPKQKVALAKQLNLRPRQVEVWFQNRRARTKLKQTEVDCEYLKRCCENLTEENRRLHKELQELRALKTTNPFYAQLPATTLTMCPSCERVATTSTAPPPTKPTDPTSKTTAPFPLSRPPSNTLFPFPPATPDHPHQPAAS